MPTLVIIEAAGCGACMRFVSTEQAALLAGINKIPGLTVRIVKLSSTGGLIQEPDLVHLNKYLTWFPMFLLVDGNNVTILNGTWDGRQVNPVTDSSKVPLRAEPILAWVERTTGRRRVAGTVSVPSSSTQAPATPLYARGGNVYPARNPFYST